MEMLIDFGFLVAVIIAVSELLKRTDVVKAKYLPLINVATGVIAGVVYLGGSLKENILYGIVIGLSASGLFDMTKVKK